MEYVADGRAGRQAQLIAERWTIAPGEVSYLTVEVKRVNKGR